MYFLFNFDWYSIQLDIFSQEKVGWGGGGVTLTDKIL